MGNKKKSGRVTLANILAVIGLALLFVFSFLGLYFRSGGELGWNIVVAAIITGVTAFLLWLLVTAKGAHNYLKQWKVIEIGTLIVFILFAIPVALWGGIMHFFVVNNNKEFVKECAKDDLNAIDDLFTQYKEFESQAIARTGTGLKNATGSGQRCDVSLNTFMKNNHISHNRESAKNYETIQRNRLIGAGFEKMYEQFLQEKSQIENTVNSWSIMQIPYKAKQIAQLATSIEETLTKLSKSAKLPVITYSNSSRCYVLGENQSHSFKLYDTYGEFMNPDMEDSAKSKLKFQSALQEAEGFSLTGILVFVMIEALILFNYIVAYRTNKTGPSKIMDDDGGITL